MTEIAKACGYAVAMSADSSTGIARALERLAPADGPALLEIRVNKGARASLGRPTASPATNKRELMRHLGH